MAPGRTKCNTILHLYGEWLFEAAFVGSELPQSKFYTIIWWTFIIIIFTENTGDSKRPNSIVMDGKSPLNFSQPGSMTDSSEVPSNLTIDKYESGKAEALGTLCRIMCAKKTGEEILPVYLAR